MRRLGSLDGNGKLVVDDEPLTSVDYQVDVWEDSPGGWKSAEGVLTGEMSALFKALKATSTTIVIESGKAMRVVIRTLSAEHPLARAEFEVSGPVPGF